MRHIDKLLRDDCSVAEALDIAKDCYESLRLIHTEILHLTDIPALEAARRCAEFAGMESAVQGQLERLLSEGNRSPFGGRMR